MVWHFGPLCLLLVSNHDFGKLVHGDRAPGDGALPLCVDVFVPFIMVTTFAVVNLLVGLIVNSMQDAHSEEADQKTNSYRDEVLERLKAIEGQMNINR